MKKLLKGITITLAAIILVAMLVACGGNNNNDPPANDRNNDPAPTASPSPSPSPEPTQPDVGVIETPDVLDTPVSLDELHTTLDPVLVGLWIWEEDGVSGYWFFEDGFGLREWAGIEGEFYWGVTDTGLIALQTIYGLELWYATLYDDDTTLVMTADGFPEFVMIYTDPNTLDLDDLDDEWGLVPALVGVWIWEDDGESGYVFYDDGFGFRDFGIGVQEFYWGIDAATGSILGLEFDHGVELWHVELYDEEGVLVIDSAQEPGFGPFVMVYAGQPQ